MGYRIFVRLASVCFTILFLCLMPGPAVWAATPVDGLWIGRTDQGHVFYFLTNHKLILEIGTRFEVSNEQCGKLTTVFLENTDQTPLQDDGFELSTNYEQSAVDIAGTFTGPDYSTGIWKAEDAGCGWTGEGTWYAVSAAEEVKAAVPVDSNSRALAELKQGQDFGVYSITLPTNNRLTPNTNDIQLTVYTTGETDTVGILFDQGLQRALAYDDESNPPGNFRISELLPSGQYYLVVIGYKEDTVGDYDLYVTII